MTSARAPSGSSPPAAPPGRRRRIGTALAVGLAGGAAAAADAPAGTALPFGAVAGSMLAIGALGWLAMRRFVAGARRAPAAPDAPDAPDVLDAPAAPAALDTPAGPAAPVGPAGSAVPTAPVAPVASDGVAGRVAPSPDGEAPPAAPAPDAAGARAQARGSAARLAPSSVPASPPPVAAPPAARPGASDAEVLDVIRRLSREVYWEQDEHGTLRRVDDGPAASPLRLRLGRCRWDDGAMPLDAPDWGAHRERLARHEPFADLAWVWIDAAGRVRAAIDSGVPRFDADGRFVGYAGVSRDAGPEIVAERTRKLALAALLAATEPVVWIEAAPGTAQGWQLVWANAAACRLFDRPESELRRLPWRAMFGPDSQAAAAGIEQALRQRRECRLHLDVARKYGEVRSVELRLEPLPGDGSLRPCAALLLHDRSADQERLREDSRAIERLRTRMRERTIELESTARELESFTYTVSHDLRAPIRVVEGFARILQEDYADRLDRLGHDHLQRILGAATRMTQMIDALLELSRLSGQPLVPEQVDLSRLADTIVDELRAGDPARRVSVRVQPGMAVEGDRTLLRVMLENLLGNAWKYSARRDEARIEFGCTGSGADAVWCVSDDGEGFDMRFADRLFGVFQRLHSAAEFPGTGVGLATVQRIVRRHGGRVWAESEPGRGARFLFTLHEKPGR